MSTIPQGPWLQSVQAAFQDQELCRRIIHAAAAEPFHLPQLFNDISQFVLSLKEQVSVPHASVPANKKRKLEDGGDVASNGAIPLHSAHSQAPLKPFFECKDVSVQVPVRKKLKIELADDGANGQITLFNSATADVEYGLRAADVDQAFCLPVPEKQARQMNFVLFPTAGALDASGNPAEQVLFVMNETTPPSGSLPGEPTTEDDTYVTVTERALERWLRPQGKSIIKPRADEFASSIPQSHRKGEKAYHVKAHRGSKEGYLFFLENGIVFGFKKPLAFFPFSAIESISYTSVLQRTFNLVIAAMEIGQSEAKEIEFSMLDQEDFTGIDTYIKKHGLNDASMAAQRRAKAYNINKEKKAVEPNGEVAGAVEQDEDGQTELQKAEQQLQDEEDELEEDYEVSGGESEGEGESSEEEEEYEDEDVEEVEGEQEDEDQVGEDVDDED